MQGHASPLLDEEKDEAVVLIIHVDGDTIQISFEVVGALALTVHSHLFGGDCLHAVDHGLAGRVDDGAVEVGAMAGAPLRRQAQVLDLSDKLLHSFVCLLHSCYFLSIISEK